MATDAVVLTDIRNMIDLAIGTPEVGVVDFCMLHTVLHCLAQQMHVLDKPVELRGSAATLPTGGPAIKDNGQTVAIMEYIVETDVASPVKPANLKPVPASAEPPTLLVVERIRKDSSPDRMPAVKVPDRSPGHGKSSGTSSEGRGRGGEKGAGGQGAGGQGAGGQRDGGQRDGGMGGEETVQEETGDEREERDTTGGRAREPRESRAREPRESRAREPREPYAMSSTEKLSLVTLSKFNLLEDVVQDLKDRVYGSMPKNEQILEEVRSQTNLKAITDMWTNLNVSSRLEAAETGLGKLSSLVEDLIKEASQRPAISGQAPPAQAQTFAPAAQGPAAQAPAAQAPAAQAPAAQAPAAQAQAAQAPAAQAQAAQQPAAQAPAAQAPGAPAPAAQAAAAQAQAGGGQAPGAQTYAAGGQAPGAQTYAAGGQAPGAQTYAAGGQAPGPQAYAGQPQWQPPPQVLEAANLIAQLGPPFPWDTMAAELYEERVSVLSQLQRLRSDIDTLNKAFFDAMQSMQDGLDPKEAASMVVMAAAAAPSEPPPPPTLPPPLPPVPTAILVPPQAQAPAYAQAQAPAYAQPQAQAQAPPYAQPQAQAPAYAQPQAQAPAHAQPQAMVAPPQYAQMMPADGRGGRRSSGSSAAMQDRLAQLEKRIKECCDGMGKDKGSVQDQLDNFQNQLDKLMRQVAGLHDDFSALKISPNLAKDLEGLMQLYKTVQDMQEQLRQVNETARLLAGEKDDRQHHMNALLEQIEILKTIKMDREDMAEAMAEKADLRLLARKVSHDQFEMACDDLSRGLEHALGKLNTQESLWQQVLDDIQREIETKLDKMELSPLKEFFNNKLRQLQDNLKQMASLRRDVEAAGTSRRLLRDVNCISCDAKAVMQMENTGSTPSKPMPAHLSMKPYLSYELDSIRKTQASNLQQRNLHDWETIDKQMAPKPPVRVRSETDKHICNRYCGGSHTTTTPAQRVARLGHFIKQWGPDVVPLSSGLAAGDDGRIRAVEELDRLDIHVMVKSMLMSFCIFFDNYADEVYTKLYKVSTAEHASVGPGGPVDPTCTKKPKAPEPAKPAPKPLIPTPECRCLDGGI